MTEPKPLQVILHLRVPSILSGRDHQRYLERKLRDLDVRLRPPPTLIGTDIPVGYGLVRPCDRGWSIVEARGEIGDRLQIFVLHQHELVEEVLEEAIEEWRRAERAAERGDAPPPEDGGDENITAGGPMPHPITMGTLWIALFILKPLTWTYRGITSIRRWYVREHG